MRKLIAWDLFCRSGGISAGLTKCGFEVVLGIDIEKRCRETFEYNHPGATFLCADVKTLGIDPKKNEIVVVENSLPCRELRFKRPDLIVGGPPCNEHSSAGYGWDHDPFGRGMECVHEFMRFVNSIQPKWWVAENVPEIRPLWHQFYPEVRTVILDAVNYGVPQFRPRCFAGNFPIPPETHSRVPSVNLLGQRRERWRNWDDAIVGCENLPNQDQRTPLTEKGLAKIRRGFGMQKRRILKVGQPAPALTDNHGDAPVDPRTMQCLSVRECARVQSFPDDFVFFGGKGFNLSCVGLSVAPLLAQRIGESILCSR